MAMTTSTATTASVSDIHTCFSFIKNHTVVQIDSIIFYSARARSSLIFSHTATALKLLCIVCSTLGPYSAKNLFTFYIHNRFNSTLVVYNEEILMCKILNIAFNFRHCCHRARAPRTHPTQPHPSNMPLHTFLHVLRFIIFFFQFFSILATAVMVAAATVILGCDMTHCVRLDYHYYAYALLYLKYMCLLHCATRIQYFSHKITLYRIRMLHTHNHMECERHCEKIELDAHTRTHNTKRHSSKKRAHDKYPYSMRQVENSMRNDNDENGRKKGGSNSSGNGGKCKKIF